MELEVYITKYALTKGIFKAKVKQLGDDTVEVQDSFLPTYYHGNGREWCLTKEFAIKRAEEMRKKKLDSLKNQIQTLKNLDFEKMCGE